MSVPEFYSGKILYPAIVVLIGLSALFGFTILPRLNSRQHPLVGQVAPDAAFPVAANGDEGARMQISSLRGHTVVLDFWASYCGPCAIEAPILDRIARRYEKDGLVVLGVNIDDSAQVARAYAARKGLSYPIVIDATHEAQTRYDVDKLPSLVVIDRKGRVSAYLAGVVDETALDQIVAAAM